MTTCSFLVACSFCTRPSTYRDKSRIAPISGRSDQVYPIRVGNDGQVDVLEGCLTVQQNEVVLGAQELQCSFDRMVSVFQEPP